MPNSPDAAHLLDAAERIEKISAQTETEAARRHKRVMRVVAAAIVAILLLTGSVVGAEWRQAERSERAAAERAALSQDFASLRVQLDQARASDCALYRTLLRANDRPDVTPSEELREFLDELRRRVEELRCPDAPPAGDTQP